MKHRGSFVQGWADVVGLVVKAPRTCQELRDLTGLSKNTIFRILHALANEGLVKQDTAARVDGRDLEAGRLPDLWTWAP